MYLERWTEVNTLVLDIHGGQCSKKLSSYLYTHIRRLKHFLWKRWKGFVSWQHRKREIMVSWCWNMLWSNLPTTFLSVSPHSPFSSYLPIISLCIPLLPTLPVFLLSPLTFQLVFQSADPDRDGLCLLPGNTGWQLHGRGPVQRRQQGVWGRINHITYDVIFACWTETEEKESLCRAFVGQGLTWYPVLVEWKAVMRYWRVTGRPSSILKHNKPCIAEQREARRYCLVRGSPGLLGY